MDGVSDVNARRRQRAIRATRTVAARFGVAAEVPLVLHDSNNTVIHLAPAPVVAKVRTSPEEASLGDELRVARHLLARGGSVVPPAALVPPGPYVEDGLEMTFWEYCPHQGGEPDPDEMGRSLRLLHDALDGYPEPLPPWNRFDGVDRVVANSAALRSLPPEDRVFLRDMYRQLLERIARFDPPVRPLHGEPHSGNLLRSETGLRWIDFESACIGPREWDLTVLPDEVVARYFGEVDWDLLAVLRQMRSLCVAVWCRLDPDRSPVLREAGEYHLGLLKGAGWGEGRRRWER